MIGINYNFSTLYRSYIMTADTTMADLEHEFTQMRNTIKGLLTVIKQQDARITTLEATLASVPTMSREEVLLDRYTTSSKVNRAVNADPEIVAFAAHLFYIKQIPAMRISESGLLSQSKMYGLSQWSKQHLLDYCEVNDVKDIYLNGLDEDKARELMPQYDLYQEYLAKTRNNNLTV